MKSDSEYEEAFREVGLDVESNGAKDIDEEYIRKDNGQTVVKISPEFFRPVELAVLRGSNSKVREKLKWEPKLKFRDLVKIMVEHETQMARHRQYVRKVKS